MIDTNKTIKSVLMTCCRGRHGLSKINHIYPSHTHYT